MSGVRVRRRDLVALMVGAVIGALLIGPDPFFFAQQDQLVALSARNSLPTMYFFRESSLRVA